jgi:hypothetical protein
MMSISASETAPPPGWFAAIKLPPRVPIIVHLFVKPTLLMAVAKKCQNPDSGPKNGPSCNPHSPSRSSTSVLLSALTHCLASVNRQIQNQTLDFVTATIVTRNIQGKVNLGSKSLRRTFTDYQIEQFMDHIDDAQPAPPALHHLHPAIMQTNHRGQFRSSADRDSRPDPANFGQ